MFIGPSMRSSAPSQPSSLASPSVQSFLSPTSPLQPPSLYSCLVLSPISLVKSGHVINVSTRIWPRFTPQASLHPSSLSRQRSAYHNQSQDLTGAGFVSRASIDYPDLSLVSFQARPITSTDYQDCHHHVFTEDNSARPDRLYTTMCR